MATNSGIEWTDATWNPIAGCSIVSPGCHSCYAVRMAGRLEAMGQKKYAGTTKKTNGKTLWTGKITLDESALTIPFGWKKPKRIFVNSMSDLFHEDVPDEFIDKVFAVMALTPQHTYQILTKRAWNLARYAGNHCRKAAVCLVAKERTRDKEIDVHPCGRVVNKAEAWLAASGTEGMPWPLPNVWLGVSVEDQQRADERIPLLLQTPAAVRFLSCEPLLSAVNLEPFMQYPPFHEDYKLHYPGGGINWVIIGGESGHGSRPCQVEWIRSIVGQCRAAAVPVFVKQLGANYVDAVNGICGHSTKWPYDILPSGPTRRFKDSKGGDWSEWPEDLRVRQFPKQLEIA